MTLLDTRNRFYADTEILAEPLDANFASIWGVVNGGITGDNIVGRSIGNGNLADNCIDASKLAQTNVISNQHIVDGTVNGESKLAHRSTSGDRLKLNAVGNDELAYGAVHEDKINDGAVTKAKISYDYSTSPIDDSGWVTTSGNAVVIMSGRNRALLFTATVSSGHDVSINQDGWFSVDGINQPYIVSLKNASDRPAGATAVIPATGVVTDTNGKMGTVIVELYQGTGNIKIISGMSPNGQMWTLGQGTKIRLYLSWIV